MSNKLGLRIGTHAIGWTFYRSKDQTLKMGVRVYPVPIEHYGAGKREQSHRARRRQARLMRKRFSRFRRRKIHLLKILEQAGMCPISKSEIQVWQQNKIFPHQSLHAWVAMCPYTLRKKGLTQKLSLHELGRILYHISQRRGFFVGRRMGQLPQKYLFQGSPEHHRPGILATEKNMHNESLGTYLHTLLPEPNKSYKRSRLRVRNRYLSRQMYVEEIHKIWAKQAQAHPQLTPDLRDKLIGKPPGKGNYTGGVIFYQRPFSVQKSRLAKCPYEPQKSRTVYSHPLYEELRAWQWVNSLRLRGESLDMNRKKEFLNYFLSHGRFTFWEALQVVDSNEKGYNRHHKKMVQGAAFQALMQQDRNFGVHWKQLSEEAKIDVWHSFYFFNSQQKLADKAHLDWGFSTAAASRISRIFVDKRVAPLSLKAVRNILEFLRRGFSYEEAVFLAGLRKSLGHNWPGISELEKLTPIGELLSWVREKDYQKLLDLLGNLCQTHGWSLDTSKLYGIGREAFNSKKSPVETDLLTNSQIEQLNQPIQIAAAFQLRKIIRQLIEKYGAINQIKVTFDTDIKVNRIQRGMYLMEQKRRQKLHERFSQILKNNHILDSQENIERLELWGECSHICPYSGLAISFDELFSDAVEVLMIHPWEKSLNKSMVNKVLCRSEFADSFRRQSPREYYAKDPSGWKILKERTLENFMDRVDYPFAELKAQKFLKRFPRKNYIEYQWHENGLIGNAFQQLLRQICPEVHIHAIHGVQYLLEHWKSDFLGEVIDLPEHKDYRWKGLQAAATLFINRPYLDFLAQNQKFNLLEAPQPVQKFPALLSQSFRQLLVSHVQKRKILFTRHKTTTLNGRERSNYHLGIRGSIHRETRYGKAKAPQLSEAFHVRKSLREFTNFRQLNKIVDPQIRALVRKHAEKDNPLSDHLISKKTFFEKDDAGYDIPRVFLNNRNGDPVPIRKVRIREVFNSAVQLNPDVNAYVNPRKNHHIIIYENPEGEYRESLVSFWEALQRLRKGEPLYQMPEPKSRFVCSLHINDFFLLGLENPKEAFENLSQQALIPYVYRVQKLSKHFYEFRRTSDASLYTYEYPQYIRINNFGDRKTGWFTYNPYKIEVNSLGEIRKP